MARRRRSGGGGAAKSTRQTRRSKRIEKVNGVIESKDDDSNCAMETDSTNGGGDNDEEVGNRDEGPPTGEPVVHHKKFGKIRMSGENENSFTETPVKECSQIGSKPSEKNVSETRELDTFGNDTSVLDIMRGMEISGQKGRSSYSDFRKQSSVYNAENDIPLDGSVIIKPGTFSSNTITSSVKSNVYFNATANSELSSVNFLKVLEGIEMLERNVASSLDYNDSSTKESEGLIPDDQPSESSYINDGSITVLSNSEKLDLDIKVEKEEEKCSEDLKSDLSVKPMDISSPEDTSSDLQNETEETARKLDNIVLEDKQETSESCTSKNSDDLSDKKPAARNRTGSSDTADSESSSNGGASVRRSNRIRSISILKQKEKEQTAVKTEVGLKSSQAPGSPGATPQVSAFDEKPVKVKSRWRRSSELEMHSGRILDTDGITSNCSSPVNCLSQPIGSFEPTLEDLEKLEREKREIEEGLKSFTILTENEYKTERSACKETKRMICDCVLTKEEISRGEVGCGEDCLNRMLFLECGPRCALGERCTNKRFQKLEYSSCKIFKTEKKGFGLRAEEDLPGNTFIMEYVGEVVNQKEFERRVKMYAKDNNKHFYFMALKGDAVIDATNKGNISRFINHSCDPNAETQKWTINGELRVGFFTRRFIPAGEEITFDYQFQRYGKQAQKCFCEAPSCRGWIGENPEDTDEDEDEEEEEEDDEEDEEEEVEYQIGTLKSEEDAEDSKEGKKISKVEDKDKSDDKSAKLTVRKVKKEKKKHLEKKKVTTFVDDMGLDEEIQKLFKSGLKNRAHTLTLSRLMVRAEDWTTRSKLLQLIREGETACRRLFLDYHGLRLICSWMVCRELEENEDKNERRIEILKTLQTLPIPNKNMLIDSKVLNVVEQWSKSGCVSRKLSVDEESGSDEKEKKKLEEGLTNQNEDTTDASDNKENFVKIEKEKPEGNKESLEKVKKLAEAVLESWSPLKEVFKIPKKERIEQMKEHERQADRGYSEYLDNKENFRDKYERHDRYGRSDRYRNERMRDRKRTRESPPDPDWFRNHESSKLTKQERRQLFALKVLQEDEEAKKRSEQLELWKQHESRCLALGLDPNLNAACDPQTGFPIFFDHNSGTWQNCPPSSGPSPSLSHSTTPSMCPSPMYSGGAPMMHNNCHMCPTMPMCSPMNNPLCPNPPGPNGIMPLNSLPLPNGPIPLPPHPGQPLHANVTPQYQGPPSADFENMPPPGYVESENPNMVYEETIINEMTRPVITEIPLNAPIKLPPKWKSAKDPKGRVYYYHVKERISQWEPPQWTEEDAKIEAAKTVALEMGDESSSSTESSSESSSEEEDDAENADADETSKQTESSQSTENVTETLENTESKANEGEEAISRAFEDEKDEELSAWEEEEEEVVVKEVTAPPAETATTPSRSILSKPPVKVRRAGLVQEIIISPRREEDRIDNRKFKEVKEMLRRQKEEARAKMRMKGKEGIRVSKSRKKRKDKMHYGNRGKVEKLSSSGSESVTDKRIKENFKNSMAGAIVSHLNPYRKKDCKVGRITSNEDFKHLARKLTHFVMLKELKHCKGVDDLECNDSVKAKAKDFIKKYMAKFGAVYQRPQHEVWKT